MRIDADFAQRLLDAKDARIAELEARVEALTLKPETVAALLLTTREEAAWQRTHYPGHAAAPLRVCADFDRYAKAIGGADV